MLNPICKMDRMLVKMIEKISVKNDVRNRKEISDIIVNRKALNVDMIAHACGGGIGYIYSNSYEACIYSINSGYQCIEVDVLKTKDHKWVCCHEFKNNIVPTMEDFLQDEYEPRWTGMRLDTCLKIARDYDVKVIIDTKKREQLQELVRYLNSVAKDNLQNIWIQIYSESDGDIIGHRNVLYNLTFEKDYYRVVQYCTAYGIKDVSIHIDAYKNMNDKELKCFRDRNIDIYVHTINDKKTYGRLKKLGVKGIFTDTFNR